MKLCIFYLVFKTSIETMRESECILAIMMSQKVYIKDMHYTVDRQCTVYLILIYPRLYCKLYALLNIIKLIVSQKFTNKMIIIRFTNKAIHAPRTRFNTCKL